jgi:hypothetical protein
MEQNLVVVQLIKNFPDFYGTRGVVIVFSTGKAKRRCVYLDIMRPYSGAFALQGKSPWYPLDRGLGGPQSWLDVVAERKFITSAGNRNTVVEPAACHVPYCIIPVLFKCYVCCYLQEI